MSWVRAGSTPTWTGPAGAQQWRRQLACTQMFPDVDSATVAALFQPLRQREQVDLDLLRADLIRVVRGTIQRGFVGLLLRSPGGPP